MQNGDNTKKRPSFLIFLGLGDSPHHRRVAGGYLHNRGGYLGAARRYLQRRGDYKNNRQTSKIEEFLKKVE